MYINSTTILTELLCFVNKVDQTNCVAINAVNLNNIWLVGQRNSDRNSWIIPYSLQIGLIAAAFLIVNLDEFHSHLTCWTQEFWSENLEKFHGHHSIRDRVLRRELKTDSYSKDLLFLTCVAFCVITFEPIMI